MMIKIKLIVLAMSAVFLLSGCVGSGGFGGFKRSLNTKSYGYKKVIDPTGKAPTEKVDRFEVRPGDCSSNSGWSDCAKDRERSELGQRSKNNYPGTEYWYGWSIFIPKDYPNVFPTKVALGQFHQKDSYPVWMFQNGKGGYALDQGVSGQTERLYPLISQDELLGRWHRIEVHVKWEKDDSGLFDLWVNSEKKVEYKGKTMSASAAYFKYGIYRSFLSRYKRAEKKEKVPTQVVMYANVKRGLTREAIQVVEAK